MPTIRVPIDKLRKGDQLDWGVFDHFVPDPHPEGRAGWIVFEDGYSYSESRGALVEVHNAEKGETR